MTNWPRGGYSASDTPASELKPPPDSMISKSSLPATYTAAEVKVLTEAALRLGRKEAGEEIAAAIEALDGPMTGENTSSDYLAVAAGLAHSIASQPSPNATSGRTDPGRHSDLPPEPKPPAWVYDLVIELLDQEELHPTLYFTSGAFEGYAKYDWCPNVALEKLPNDVLEKAEAIRAYKRNQEAG